MDGQNLSLPPELARLSAFIDSNTECLARSSSELRSVALCAAKYLFDWALETEASSRPHLGTLLATLTETAPPQTRSRTRGTSTTQRRSPIPVDKHENIRETPLASLFIEGMNIDQIWQQLDLRAARVCENLQVLQGDDEGEDANLEGDSDDDASTDDGEDEEFAVMDVDEEESEDGGSSPERLSGEEEGNSSTMEGVIDLREETSESEDDGEDLGPPTSMPDAVRGRRKLRSQGHSPLDDGFFDLMAFNAETSGAKESLERKSDRAADEDSTEESGVDLFGLVDDLESRDGGGDLELFYNDFFDPPVRMQNGSFVPSRVRFHERVSVKKIKPVGKGMPVSSMGGEEESEE